MHAKDDSNGSNSTAKYSPLLDAESAYVSPIDAATISVFQWVVYAVVCQVLDVFGISSNIINIICFIKQGFKDPVNISLLALAVSDLGSLLTMSWICICVTPSVLTADLPFEPMDTLYLTGAMPHISFTRVSSCITAMITIERCLCISAPLKIKSIITPKRATVITTCAFLIFFFSGTPVFVVNSMGPKYYVNRNKTLIGMLSTDDRESVETVSFIINFLIPVAAFVIIVVCTAILAFKLKSQSKWRQQTIKSAQDDKVSSRNQRVAKMVVMISTLTIVCFIPISVNLVAAALIPELLINGKYMNISVMLAGFGYVMECINSSMNIFIYYRMSSVYRDTFQNLFIQTKRQAIQ